MIKQGFIFKDDKKDDKGPKPQYPPAGIPTGK